MSFNDLSNPNEGFFDGGFHDTGAIFCVEPITDDKPKKLPVFMFASRTHRMPISYKPHALPVSQNPFDKGNLYRVDKNLYEIIYLVNEYFYHLDICSHMSFNRYESTFNIRFKSELEDADTDSDADADADAEKKNPNLEIRIHECAEGGHCVYIKHELYTRINGEGRFNDRPNPEIIDGLKKALDSRL